MNFKSILGSTKAFKGHPPVRSMDGGEQHYFSQGPLEKIFRRNSLGEDRELSPVDKTKKLD